MTSPAMAVKSSTRRTSIGWLLRESASPAATARSPYALPPALAKIGEDVSVVMPRYGSVNVMGEERIWDTMHLTVGPHAFTAAIDEAKKATGIIREVAFGEVSDFSVLRAAQREMSAR